MITSEILYFTLMLFCCYITGTESYSCNVDQFNCFGNQCINSSLRCDGHYDCQDKSDEDLCDVERRALMWILQQRSNGTDNLGWEVDSRRAIVALYLVDDRFFAPGNSSGKQFTTELHISLLSSLLRNNSNPISSIELALYINALLVTCTDPRNFYGVDLVKTLREQADAAESNFTNPFVVLTLCNAKERLNSKDIATLLDALKPRPSVSFWMEIQALAVMALTCFEKQGQRKQSYADEILKATQSFKAQQQSDGSFNTVQTTAVVMQALFGSESEIEDWDSTSAAKYLGKSQKLNGSFGDFLTTYYVIPVCSRRSLLNIGMTKCSYKSKDGKIPQDKDRIVMWYKSLPE